MTVDFIPLKLYVVKVILPCLTGGKGSRMRHSVTSMGSFYYFSQVRFAGRYYRALNQEDRPVKTGKTL